MSRIGRIPVAIPAGVKVTLNGNVINVKGPKGDLTQALHSDMVVNVSDKEITVTRPSEAKEHKALHGLTRTLIYNMIVGVTEGYSKKLEVRGVGYKAAKQGKDVVLNLGFSHDVIINEIPGITLEVENGDANAANFIIVSGADKQQVGQVAAVIRSKRPPEPYHGKGIRYSDEVVRHKSGKAGK